MSKYLFAFHGGKMPENPEDMQAIMSKWEQWMKSLGKDILDPGSIVGNNRCISASGNEQLAANTNLTGYMVISSHSLDTALEAARACPILQNEGSIEVAEFMTPA